MIRRFSSRRESISDSLLNNRLKNAKSYDRIAGFFRSSIFEVAGEALESVSGQIQIVCNSELLAEDVRTAKLANASMRKEWCEGKPEELENAGNRFQRLYEFLKSGKMQVRVLPNDKFGLIHGKAGVITLEDGCKTAFLGSVNESKTAWKINYELVWEDDSKEAVNWVQEEFDSLWHDITARDLSDFIIEDIKRISKRVEIDEVAKWKEEESEAAAVAVESPVYREQLGLWEHQKYFVDAAFRDHKKSYGARYILADQVGLGKTIQATDPKFIKTVELLKEGWKNKGVIIFSQYFDTAFWAAENLSKELPSTEIALYAGGDKSGVFFNGDFKKEYKDTIKAGVKSHKYKILVGTDSASEGLNLQTLGTLINLDLPWNPTRLEQRKGRIQRIGQVNDTVHIYNMRYKDSVEDRVHDLLSERLKNITSIFGQLPDVLEDVWIEVAQGEIEAAKKIIDNVPDKNPFEVRYNQNVSNIDWETCSKVLNNQEKRRYFKDSW